MLGVWSAARHEVTCLRRERLPMVLLIAFVFMVSMSGLIGWLTNTTVSDVWVKTTEAGLTSAPNPFADVSPLYYARNTIIYLVLVGALMAVVVGVVSGIRDRKARTTDLVLSRPIGVQGYLVGKLLGIALWMAAVIGVVFVATWISIAVITRAPLTVGDSGRLLAFFAVAVVLLMAFVTLGLLSGIYATRETTALLVPISLWSVVAFVLPQIGTAANPVSMLNPVPAVVDPGGAFDVLNAWVSPLSITEQFKRASGQILGDPNATGDLTVALTIVFGALVLGVIALLATRRDRIRGALRD